MLTTTHALLGVTLLGLRRDEDAPAAYVAPAIFGGVLPDLPMFWFYFYEKVVLGTPDQLIWDERYFDEGWHAFFDLFNSIPIALLALYLGVALKSRFVQVASLSVVMHALCDLPLHVEDAHRHFYPLLDWRFVSPISYWDPAHYGHIAAPAEMVLALGCCAVLWSRHPSRSGRVAIALIILLYIVFLFGLMWSIMGSG